MSGTGDVLLRWASEEGAGDLPALKQGIWWLAAKSTEDLEPGAAGRWLRDMVALGYLDIDWRNRRWCAAPAVVTRLPGGIGLAVLTGSRTADIEHRVEDTSDFGLIVHRVASTTSEQDIPLPHSLLIQYRDLDDLAEWAAENQLQFVPCFALQAAIMLSRLPLGERTAGPVSGEPLEQYDLRRRQYVPVQRARSDGLFRFRRRDSKDVCQLQRGGQWYEIAHEYGVYQELQRVSIDGQGGDVMRWFPEKAPGREAFGRLHVDWGFPLPDLQRKIAVLCSGLAPQIHAKAQNIAYDNVPRAVARMIADSLGQCLGDTE
ncbi:hypothetical protein ACIG0C_33930 [Kitasatospora aureofaciens]|uniref:Uncharacterized protein n=1 Tax=Kitasatospora aureofaciens TaxID=1894 RepID=A0A8H9LRL8_KITAU|nr:hypothetical protein [Kitasatospora aureofaciens]GGV05584.1 hypothetical protein GCM10010502_70650 [Kitasatospora aureofaciens]